MVTFIDEWRRKFVMYGSEKVNHISAGIDFKREILTSIEVRICSLKSIPALKEGNIYNSRRPIT